MENGSPTGFSTDEFLRSLNDFVLDHPFGGYRSDSDSTEAFAPVGPHLLVSGPTGSGKSRRVLGPAMLLHDGPVVAVSSKPDLQSLVSEQRIGAGGEGRTWLLDLSGKVPDSDLPPGMSKAWLDPTVLAKDDDSALDLASIMVDAAVGRTGSDPYWSNATVPIVAALLRAAGSDGVAWAARAAGVAERMLRSSPFWEIENLHKAGHFTSQEEYDAAFAAVEAWRGDRRLWDAVYTEALPCWDPSEPNWLNAAGRLQMLGSYELSMSLRTILHSDADKMVSSLVNMAMQAFSPWLRSSLRAPEGGTLVDPSMLTHPRASLFVIAPMDGVAAPAAIMALDAIAARWRDGQTEERALPKLLFVIDEMMNTAPWSKLPVVVTEARGMGISIIGAVQSTMQFAKRFGPLGMDELREVFPSTLLLAGAVEPALMLSMEVKLSALERCNGVVPDPKPLPLIRDEGLLLHNSPPDDVDAASAVDHHQGMSVRLRDLSEIQCPLQRVPAEFVQAFDGDRIVVADMPDLIARRMRVVEILRMRAMRRSMDDAASTATEEAEIDVEWDDWDEKDFLFLSEEVDA